MLDNLCCGSFLAYAARPLLDVHPGIQNYCINIPAIQNYWINDDTIHDFSQISRQNLDEGPLRDVHHLQDQPETCQQM